MPTKVTIDDSLLKRALKAGGLRTKKETVKAALQEFITRRRQGGILKSFGRFEFREDWDYKKERAGRK